METIQNYQILKILGKGSFATVYLAQRLSDQTKCALKKIILKGATEKEKKNALNEVRLLSSVSCEHIIKFHNAFYDSVTEDLYVAMEYAEKGDLSSKIEDHISSGQPIPQSQIWTILQHIAKGLSSLHRKNILHRDLKSANVFQTNSATFKIADLNVSKLLSNEHQLAQTQIGTPFYASPQVWENHSYDSKADIWSLGIIAYELAMLKMPFPGKTINELYTRITRGKYQKISNKYSQSLRHLIDEMLNPIPSKRPTSDSIVACAVLNKVSQPIKKPKWNALLNDLLTEWQDPQVVNLQSRRQKKYTNKRERVSEMKRNVPSYCLKQLPNESQNYSVHRIESKQNMEHRSSNRTERQGVERARRIKILSARGATSTKRVL